MSSDDRDMTMERAAQIAARALERIAAALDDIAESLCEDDDEDEEDEDEVEME